MFYKLHNLLPKDKKKSIKREYYMRLVVLFLLGVSFSVFVGIFSLLPAYIKLSQDFKSKQLEYSHISLNLEDENDIYNDAEKTMSVLNIINTEMKRDKLTSFLKEVLNKRPKGIDIVGFTFNRDKSTLSFEGVSKTRNLVVPYANELEGVSMFENVNVPISNLTKNTDLNFHMSLSVSDIEK